MDVCCASYSMYIIGGRDDDARSIWTAGKFRVDKVMIFMGIDI